MEIIQKNVVRTTPREVKSPTYPLQIKKTDSGETNMLAGATFKLYTKEDDANKDINAITITKRQMEDIYLIKSSNTEMISIRSKSQ